MDKKIIIAIVASAALILVIGILIPGGHGQPEQIFPWQIETAPDGTSRVFGLTLSQSTTQDAERRFRTAAKISLFSAPEKLPVVEAYFDKISPAGLSAQMVIGIDVSATQIQTIFERGARISTLGNGSRKVDLSDQDLAKVRGLPISTITYLPRVSLQAEIIQKRFGEPAQRIVEPENYTEHWLYPQLGLDVAMNANGKAILQYVAPAEFDRLRRPLQK